MTTQPIAGRRSYVNNLLCNRELQHFNSLNGYLVICLFVTAQSPVPKNRKDEEDLLLKRRVEIQRMFEFAKWSELERRPGYGLSELPDIQTALQSKYPRTVITGPRVPTSRRMSLSISPGKEGHSRSRVDIEVCESASKAKERILDALGDTSLPDNLLRIVADAPQLDIGDVAFSLGGKQPHVIYFARNNVFVRTLESVSDGDAQVLSIARDVDDALDRHLRRMAFPLPKEDTWKDPSVTPPLPHDLTDAAAANNVAVLGQYVVSSHTEESELAITALATTGPGREALFIALSKPETDKLRVRLILAALGNAATPDALEYVKRYAASTEDPRLYGAAIEAAAKAMPLDESRRFCIEEVKRLSEHLDASAGKLTCIVRGLSLGLMRDGDPEETLLLREIVARTANEALRLAALRALAAWVADGSDLRGGIVLMMKAQLSAEAPDVRALEETISQQQ